MNRLAQELDEKLRSLDTARAQELESLVRNALKQVEQESASNGVSEDRRNALYRLIGIWKSDRPPTDAEVEQIVEEERMKKHG